MTGLKRDTWDDAWIALGALHGLEAGDKTVKRLELREAGPEPGLAGLSRFPELEALSIIGAGALDLSPLAHTKLTAIHLENVGRCDLLSLAAIPTLRILALHETDAASSGMLRLPALSSLLCSTSGGRVGTRPVVDLVDALDWTSVGELQQLILAVSEGYSDAPVRMDLGFLRELPNLQTLRIFEGILPAGPSPIDPPFDGLSRKLRYVQLCSENPELLQPELEAFVGHLDPDDPTPSGVFVYDA